MRNYRDEQLSNIAVCVHGAFHAFNVLFVLEPQKDDVNTDVASSHGMSYQKNINALFDI